LNPGSAQLDSKAKSRWVERRVSTAERQTETENECRRVECVRIDMNFNQPQLRREEYNRGMREQGES
jgi:hypothetical protein